MLTLGNQVGRQNATFLYPVYTVERSHLLAIFLFSHKWENAVYALAVLRFNEAKLAQLRAEEIDPAFSRRTGRIDTGKQLTLEAAKEKLIKVDSPLKLVMLGQFWPIGSERIKLFRRLADTPLI